MQPHGFKAYVQQTQGTGGVCMSSEGCVLDKHEVMLVYGSDTALVISSPLSHTVLFQLSQPLTYSLASHAVTLAAHFSSNDGMFVCTLAS